MLPPQGWRGEKYSDFLLNAPQISSQCLPQLGRAGCQLVGRALVKTSSSVIQNRAGSRLVSSPCAVSSEPGGSYVWKGAFYGEARGGQKATLLIFSVIHIFKCWDYRSWPPSPASRCSLKWVWGGEWYMFLTWMVLFSNMPLTLWIIYSVNNTLRE